jgi:hypothetical protein
LRGGTGCGLKDVPMRFKQTCRILVGIDGQSRAYFIG